MLTDCSNGTTQTETANTQNLITSISGGTTPTYDANGNMISASLTSQPAASDTLTYDAWNRLVKVTNSSGQIIAQYTYNAMGYRVTESYPQGGTGIPAGEIDYIYYDSQWQAIETRTNGTAASNITSQMVWSAAYINAAILRDSYGGGVAEPLARIYFLQDANWNTTAIVNFINAAWQVLQYYVYSPYGTITVLNEGGAGSTPIVNNLYQGMTLDPVTGLYYARNRNYSPTLGRWINQDPAGYINGANTYQFVMSNPVGNVDPSGCKAITNAGNAVTGAAKYAVPGGEFLEGVKALPWFLRFMLQQDAQSRYNQDTQSCPPRDPWKDPLYTGLFKWSEGDPVANFTPQEHQAVQNWLNQNGQMGFWSWLWHEIH